MSDFGDRRRSSSRERRRSRSFSRSRSRSPRAYRSDPAPNVDGSNLYVANLSYRVSQRDLEDLFGKYGKLERCFMVVDPITRESRGFSFVTYEDSRDAQDALKSLDGTELHGRKLRVEVSKRARGHEKTPGKYLGPTAASSKFSRNDRDRSGSRDYGRGRYDRDRRGRSRSRSRSRGRDRRHYSPRR